MLLPLFFFYLFFFFLFFYPRTSRYLSCVVIHIYCYLGGAGDGDGDGYMVLMLRAETREIERDVSFFFLFSSHVLSVTLLFLPATVAFFLGTTPEETATLGIANYFHIWRRYWGIVIGNVFIFMRANHLISIIDDIFICIIICIIHVS